MYRRSFLVFVSALASVIPQMAMANPFLLIVRGILGMGGRRAATATVGSVARGTGMRTASGTSRAAKAGQKVKNTVPYAARPGKQGELTRSDALSILNSGLTATSIFQTLMPKEVQAKVLSHPPESPVLAVVAYYGLLAFGRRQEQLAMWVDPPLEHFQRGAGRRQFRILVVRELYNDGTFATTRVRVKGKRGKGDWALYVLNIHWVATEYGWLISEIESI